MRLKLDTVANVIVVITCLMIMGLIGLRFQQASRLPTHGARASYKPGDRMDPLPSVDFSQSAKTLVLFFRTTCRFCTDSMPFYQRIANDPGRSAGRFRVVAASAEPLELSRGYLLEQKLMVDQLVSLRAVRVKVSSTPTLVVVDRRGAVINAWVGQQATSNEDEVLRALLAQ